MPRLQIMDTTIRDGQQSLWATRMQIGDMLPILPKMDRVGYWAIEAWGGATFDTCLRFLDENPWERLRSIKANTPNTPLSMLSRGQNLVGYKHYSREICNRFIKAANRNGIHVFRVFDALNDIRNVVDNADAIKLTHGSFAKDAIVLTDVPDSTLTLLGTKSGHGVRVDFDGFKFIGIWSPMNDAPFVALEPWTGHSTLDTEDDVFEHKDNITILAPGETDERSFSITLL